MLLAAQVMNVSMPPQFPGGPRQPEPGSPNLSPQGQPQFGAPSAGSSPYGQYSPYPGPGSPYASSANPSGPFPEGQFHPVAGAGGHGQFPQPPKKRRTWVWFVVGCGVLLLIGLLGLGGCVALVASSGSSDDGVRTGDPVTTATEVAEDAQEDVADEESEEGDAAGDADAVPAEGVGTSRDNPAQPVTDAVAIETNGGTMSVTLGNVTWDADGDIAEANMFNEEAPEGQVYITVPVTVKYEGPDSITPWLELQISYIADDGRSYNEASVVVEDDFMDVGDLYDGGTAEGTIAFLVPEEAVGSGTFSVEGFLTSGTYFVAAV